MALSHCGLVIVILASYLEVGGGEQEKGEERRGETWVCPLIRPSLEGSSSPHDGALQTSLGRDSQ